MLSRQLTRFFRQISVTNNCDRCKNALSNPTLIGNQYHTTISKDSNEDAEQTKATDVPFTGNIPVERLDISYCRGSGPGGQHVNKVNTKVEIRFHVANADWIPDWIKPRLTELSSGNISKSGYLIVTSDITRKQILNQADCMDKVRQMLFNASRKQAEPTEDDLQLKAKRIAKAQRDVLRLKREHSMKKQRRQLADVNNI